MHKRGIKYLSYGLDREVPVYGGGKASLGILPKKSLYKGDSCNTFKFSIENHWGTHMDAPAHFFKKAMTISDYPAETFIFKDPCAVEVPLKKSREIGPDELSGKIKRHHDLVLIKTGFGIHRGLEKYSCEGPSISAEVGLWLRSERPNVRAVGFDFISIGSPRNMDAGRLAHRAFLDPGQKGAPILIIEDMDLSRDLSGLKMVWAAPLLITCIDSSPCTVVGFFGQ